MRTLIFTNYNCYLATHEAFKLSVLKKWADEFEFDVFVRVSDNVPIDKHQYPNFYFSSVRPDNISLKLQIAEALKKSKPKKVVNFLEKFFPFHLVEYDAERIYFVRSCAKKLLKVLLNYAGSSTHSAIAIAKYTELTKTEGNLLNTSDRIITTSPNSKLALMEEYGLDSEICLEYIDPSKYNTLPLGTSSKIVYNIGRRDFQKGLHLIKTPTATEFLSVGVAHVGKDECIAENIKKIGLLEFDQYKSLIQDCIYGIFPCIWESNGYTVQECLAMGKIPVVQSKSGGNERFCNPNNSIIVDFDRGNFDWEECILSNSKTKEMQEAARETIEYSKHRKSLEQFIKIIK